MPRRIALAIAVAFALAGPMTGAAATEFVGVIESRPEGTSGTWIIGGRAFELTTHTRLDTEHGELKAGACAELELRGPRVEEISAERPGRCAGRPDPD